MSDVNDGAAAAQIHRVGQIFLADKARKSVTVGVLQDEGLYRHLWVTSHEGLWFEVVTWPGGLMASGEIEIRACWPGGLAGG